MADIDYGKLALQHGGEAGPAAGAGQTPMNPVGTPMGRFGTAFWEAVNPAAGVQAIADVTTQPLNMLGAIGREQGRVGQEALDAFGSGDVLTGIRKGAHWLLPVIGPELDRQADALARGDTASGAGMMAGMAANLGAAKMAPGVARGVAASGPVRAALTQEGRAAVAAARGPVETAAVVLRGAPDPVKLMTRALKPTAANTRWTQAVNTALPELKASEATMGRIQNIEDLHNALADAKKRVWAQREAIAGPQAKRGITLDPVADAMERTVSQYTELMEPAQAQAIREQAANFRGRTFTIQEAEGFLQDVNDRLSAYYAKNPRAQSVSRGRNPDTAALDAQARALRSRIYDSLDAEGQGAAPRELSRRYGALLNMEQEIYRRRNVAARQQPESLQEQIGYTDAAGDIAAGLYRMGKGAVTMSPGETLGGAADLVRGQAKRAMAKELKESATTDAMIERAMRNWTRKPLAVDYRAVQPRALLGPGPLVTEPPADPSGIVRGAPGPQGPVYDPEWMPPRPLLPAPGRPPLVTPQPADPSGIRVVPGEPFLPPGQRTLPPPQPPGRFPLHQAPVLSLWDLVKYAEEEMRRRR